MKKYITFFISTFVVLQVTAQKPCIKTEWYTTLSGTVGKENIDISVIALDDKNVIGSYCNGYSSLKTSLQGTFSLEHLLLSVVSDSTSGTFDLKPVIEDGYIDRYKGTFTTRNTDKEKEVSLVYSSGSWGLPDDRYPDFPGNDDALETFAQDVIDAVIHRDTAFLRDKMCFPAIIYLSNRKKITLQNKQDFMKHSNKIFSQEIIEKAKKWKRCNFSSNHSGVMLGRGEIWLWRSDTATAENPSYCIKNIVSEE